MAIAATEGMRSQVDLINSGTHKTTIERRRQRRRRSWDFFFFFFERKETEKGKRVLCARCRQGNEFVLYWLDTEEGTLETLPTRPEEQQQPLGRLLKGKRGQARSGHFGFFFFFFLVRVHRESCALAVNSLYI